ncbi:hypothetical protein TCAL_04421 [Tigriopus californicus]|uniref:Tyrosine-protein kinase n=1 Tax=Tigriopus californicus TaxID=6832 RepID=A0A553N801_TIGCA|nr:tyrosine-protein kinase SRK2-like [Tigriopus californicus]TRY61574.1 hypothetical protein TCAL_04421 [Tigriopus californicus]|eukprot:TCALIF_04421-PA protein Name:"Similar to Frk Tyrosine-protein kinase FRK (Rattus norvegicus)" AED:0.04 eAED:0.04 QI:0/-1/0/1/-1/1/1/0/538
MSFRVSRRRFFCRETFHPCSIKYTENILSFVAGDELEHRNAADNGTGLIAFNRRTGETGFASNEFLVTSREYIKCKESWYLGQTPREVVDEYLTENYNIHGSFLVRTSKNNPGNYVLQIKTYDFIKMKFYFSRLLIERDQNGYSLDSESCSTLKDLIETLKTKGFQLKNQTASMRPTNPCLILRSQMPGSMVMHPWQVHENDIEMGAFVRCEFPTLVFHGRFRGVVDAMVEVIGPIGRRPLKAGLNQLLAEEYKHSFLWSINHPNIMQMLGMSYNLDTKVYHLILEGACLGPLDSLLREQGRAVFNFHLFLSVARDILHALAYLQSKNYIHGNIRAHSIFINEMKQAKLCHLKLDLESPTYEKVDQNFSGEIFWSAIEVVDRNQVSHASDLWSFGVLLWEMLTFGEIPFHGMSKETMIHSVIEENYLPPCQTGFFEVPVKVLNYVYFQMIVALWNVDPKKRPSARHLLTRLQKAEKMLACPNGGDHYLSESTSGTGDSGHSHSLDTDNLSGGEGSTDSDSESSSSSESSGDQVVEEYV